MNHNQTAKNQRQKLESSNKDAIIIYVDSSIRIRTDVPQKPKNLEGNEITYLTC